MHTSRNCGLAEMVSITSTRPFPTPRCFTHSSSHSQPWAFEAWLSLTQPSTHTGPQMPQPCQAWSTRALVLVLTNNRYNLVGGCLQILYQACFQSSILYLPKSAAVQSDIICNQSWHLPAGATAYSGWLTPILTIIQCQLAQHPSPACPALPPPPNSLPPVSTLMLAVEAARQWNPSEFSHQAHSLSWV